MYVFVGQVNERFRGAGAVLTDSETSEKPILVVDTDALLKRHDARDQLAALMGFESTYEFIGLTHSQKGIERIEKKLKNWGLEIQLLLHKDEADQPVAGKRFSEHQLEILKTLKFKEGQPIVACASS